jgi:hypothetical protein
MFLRIIPLISDHPALRSLSTGLLEMFCENDPSRSTLGRYVYAHAIPSGPLWVVVASPAAPAQPYPWESADSSRLSKSFAAARCLEATQGESSLLELHAGGKPR